MPAAAPFIVRQAAVLGAGVMGAQIAAHFATQTWQRIKPFFVATTRTSRLWRPHTEQTTSLNGVVSSGI